MGTFVLPESQDQAAAARRGAPAAVESVSLKPILIGEERSSALTLMRNAIGWNGDDSYLAKIARRDPSLLLDDAGRRTSYQAGTLLDEAVYFDCMKTVAVALEAGVHPDDERAFQRPLPDGGTAGAPRLIAHRTSPFEARLPRRKMLELALKHGADPDGDIEAFQRGERNSHVRRYAIELRQHPTAAVARLADTMACIEVLLNAKPQCIEPDRPGCNSEWYGFLALLGTATVLQIEPPLDSKMAEDFRRMAELAIEKGAALNYVVPKDDLPQALWLAKNGWTTMPGILVELGAAESWELAPGTDPESLFSGPGLAVYREALMRRRLQLEAADVPELPGQAPTEPSCRRGARL